MNPLPPEIQQALQNSKQKNEELHKKRKREEIITDKKQISEFWDQAKEETKITKRKKTKLNSSAKKSKKKFSRFR
jgi:hypothetical protein